MNYVYKYIFKIKTTIVYYYFLLNTNNSQNIILHVFFFSWIIFDVISLELKIILIPRDITGKILEISIFYLKIKIQSVSFSFIFLSFFIVKITMRKVYGISYLKLNNY